MLRRIIALTGAVAAYAACDVSSYYPSDLVIAIRDESGATLRAKLRALIGDQTNITYLVAQEALYRFADIHLKVALELSINYFQEHEEYEKCSHLKKNLEFVKLLLT